MSLTSKARKLFSSRRMSAKWILAIRYLRSGGQSRWVMDGAKVNWRA